MELWVVVNEQTDTNQVSIRENVTCYHCGEECSDLEIVSNEHQFCCEGCKNVYEILNENDLCAYYNIENSPGSRQKGNESNYHKLLDDPAVRNNLIDFENEKQTRISLFIPKIHCASCIWLLENLQKLHPGIIRCDVNFPKKTAYVSFNHHETTLSGVVALLEKIGYEPEITLQNLSDKKPKRGKNRELIYKLGVAGFCFGNIMLFSFPEYFHLNELVNPGFKHFFGYLNLLLALPVVLYSGNGYFSSAFKSLRQGIVNIDVPIALGILVMFGRSCYEILTATGAGFMDGLAGLVFLLLVSRWFQNRSYDALAFDRDYKSFFPLAVSKVSNGNEVEVPLNNLKEGDVVIIKDEEIIPADGILISYKTHIDYSFVTGESDLISKKSGDKIFAGGKQKGGLMKLQLIKEVSQSYLTQLWNQEVFKKDKYAHFQNWVDRISKYFTWGVLTIATIAGVYWALMDPSKIVNAVTSVLIISCPCALALTLPFTFGSVLRILGRNNTYLKNTNSIEPLSKINSIVFDKTGTLTASSTDQIVFKNLGLDDTDLSIVKSMTRASNHPLSRSIYQHLRPYQDLNSELNVKQISGYGLTSYFNNKTYKLGSEAFVRNQGHSESSSTVLISVNDQVKGIVKFENGLRDGMDVLLKDLSKNFKLHVLSGDVESKKMELRKTISPKVKLQFDQKPIDKLNYIKLLQKDGNRVLMLGDGLNDAGALQQADVGLAVTENNNNFFPAADGMINVFELTRLHKVLKLTRRALTIIRLSFVISILYNVVGLSIAIQGNLQPVIAAIIMPLSSLSIIGFTMLCSNFAAKRIGLK